MKSVLERPATKINTRAIPAGTPALHQRTRRWWLLALAAVISMAALGGCATQESPTLLVKGPNSEVAYPVDTIIDGRSGKPVSKQEMIDELATVQLVFVGERHNAKVHHDIQLQILQALHQRNPDLKVGMEMFDRSYQKLLNDWSQGRLEEEAFIARSHWRANWRFPYELYRDILDFVKAEGLELVGLNIPFHIPPKIALGGIDSLTEADAAFLPEQVDTADAAHRQYVEEIFEKHARFGRSNFDYFYSAQCVWEEIMAESIAEHLDGGVMVALIGNGHIIEKFGVPNRAVDRTGASMRTVYLAESGRQVDLTAGDFIWVTPPATRGHRGR